MVKTNGRKIYKIIVGKKTKKSKAKKMKIILSIH